jgi:hypothetical protein
MPLRPLVLPAVVGSALTLVVIGLMSMTQVLPAGQHVIVSYGPEPRDMVQIRQGTPYVVPAGKLFILTGLGNNSTCPYLFTLSVNGQDEISAGVSGTFGSGSAVAELSSVAHVPPGFTAPAGSMLSISGSCGGGQMNPGRAWGYLANE